MKIGVLALQGAVQEHLHLLQKLGVEAITVKRAEQLEDLDGLILPGGESTTMGKLLKKYDLIESLYQMHEQGKPLFGTCAGMILLAKEIEGQTESHLGLMDVHVKRNAFGRQIASFEANLVIKEVAEDFPAVFIRAPYIASVSPSVDILAEVDGKVVMARQGPLLASAFHPELTDDVRVHQYFVKMVQESMAKPSRVRV
ncbi:pyridoxal 5'-phosphate synthase glutaminase subunit PdxT [Thermoflavimicrobium daqui]|jgi:5'-phosphate synthase pdxT subunit|uniref:Pyridoxal 5'-phosphate synthase subunit PdxT n=1 Tax=Thermoflavimicrobium daqui TaxID=2137476 RepID=A0A364K3U2_9BACL|nr:pyridoxal 5'-phosphate synthase glutaminase subunit PdxT [Thermoflavimicrobium daqui]RAL23428.1 pyridoxal 5'-phosphate synthase glutaminase subunit PdxT [Thermoflavimicrobium daqui]